MRNERACCFLFCNPHSVFLLYPVYPVHPVRFRCGTAGLSGMKEAAFWSKAASFIYRLFATGKIERRAVQVSSRYLMIVPTTVPDGFENSSSMVINRPKS
jgi:hypothetical protein